MKNVDLFDNIQTVAGNLASYCANATTRWVDRQEMELVNDRLDDVHSWRKRHEKLITKLGGEKSAKLALREYNAMLETLRK